MSDNARNDPTDRTIEPSRTVPTLGDPRPLAVVTGAASGIGRALAISLAGDGHRVAITDINGDGLAGTAAAARRCERTAYSSCSSRGMEYS
uniref:SDR family NAD(P)-dependent oxidoreductase n=1 Tax=uncultured Corynebacterium sp. TaxID=159447 RepID=UPI0025E2E50C